MRSHGSRQHKCCPRMRTACTHPGEARIAHRFGFDARRSKRARKHRWHSARRGGSRAYDARAAGGPNLPVGDRVRLAGGRWTWDMKGGCSEPTFQGNGDSASATAPSKLYSMDRAPSPSISVVHGMRFAVHSTVAGVVELGALRSRPAANSRAPKMCTTFSPGFCLHTSIEREAKVVDQKTHRIWTGELLPVPNPMSFLIYLIRFTL